MKHFTRGIAWLLCLVMLLGMLPVVSLAADNANAEAGVAPVAEVDENAIDTSIPMYQNTALSFEERAADLVARMTAKQKAGQLINNTSAISASALGGGALNVPGTVNLPSYTWWSEMLHGTRGGVNYPQNTTVASTWNPELYRAEATNIAQEVREGGSSNLNFYSPTVNMHRDPRWGRNEESYSEDVLLTTVFGTQWVLGAEGRNDDGTMVDPDGYYNLHTTIKHYVANNNEGKSSGDTTGRLRSGAISSLRMLREYYALPYGEIIRAANVSSVMTAYSHFNGDPSSYSSYLMDTLIRQIYGLKGYITSDCDSVASMQNLHYTNQHTGQEITMIEALSGALAHGEDLECNGGHSSSGSGTSGFKTDYNAQIDNMLEAAVETDKGIFTEHNVDIAVHRLMTARMQTGDFDGNIQIKQDASARKNNSTALRAERRALVEQINAEGVVMLQNKGVLPLDLSEDGVKSIVIVGSYQTSGNTGLYAQASGNEDNIQEGIYNAVRAKKSDVTFTYITSNSLTDANKQTIADADIAVVVTGTDSGYSAEDRDRASIILPNNQETLISTVGQLNPNTIAIMETCGPMRVHTWQNDVNAILWSSFQGQWKTGFGAVMAGVNPSGKVTDTWYREVNDTGESDVPPVTDYDLLPSEGKNGRTYMYYNGENAPSYPFGYGLSYTTFEYSNLKIDKTAYDANETVKVSFNVKNTGDVAGKETTQLYIAQPEAPAELQRPIRQLKGFEKVDLAPGETKTVEMEVAIPDLAFYSEEDDCFAVDTGLYQVQVGTNSAEANLTTNFTVSGAMDIYPAVVTMKANQAGDSENGIEERLIYDKNKVVNPQLTVSMNDESIYGYIIANQKSLVKSLTSTELPEGLEVTYTSNRPSVVKVENNVIKTVGPGVATITATVTYNGVTATGEEVIYVMGNSYLEDITINGQPLKGFTRDKHEYTLDIADYDEVPVVGVVNEDPDLEVTVEQFTGFPGVATITAVCESANQYDVYRIGIAGAPVATDFAEGWAAAQAKNWTVVNGTENATFGDDGLTIVGEAGTIIDGTAKNLYTMPANGEWVAQTNISLAALPTSGQQAGMVVMDTAGDNLQLVYEGGSTRYLTAYKAEGGARSQVNRLTVSAEVTELSLQIVKQANKYIFRYSFDGEIWTEFANTATANMAYPQVGVVAIGEGLTATFDGINIFNVNLLYPRLTGIALDGVALGDFDPEKFSYSSAVDLDAESAPVVTATAEDFLTVEITQADSVFGVATINVFSEASSSTYTVRFDHAPMNDYFADGDFDEGLWEILNKDETAYSVQQGKGIVMPTQRNDIYQDGSGWKNAFVTSALSNWEVVAKVVYPVRPSANYQQAMFLIWDDENNYIRLNCQNTGSNLIVEPGRETDGSFSAAGTTQVQAAADNSLTMYFKFKKDGNNYTAAFSQNGTTYTEVLNATNVNYVNPKLGMFASMNQSGNQIDVQYEYVYVAARDGLQPDFSAMFDWAAQNAADYIAAAVPAEATDNITFAAAPKGYSVSVESSNPGVITNDGTVLRSGADKTVDLTITVADDNTNASAVATVKVPGTGDGCDHEYESVVTEPTCTEDGFTTNTCTKCGVDVITGIVPALGHDWDAGVVTKEPTATKDGVKTFTCARCGETREDTIPATGKVDMSDIDFTDPASASRVTVENQTSTEVREDGLYLVTTAEAFEPCNGRIETFEPRDVVTLPVKGDWTATMKFDFSQASASNGYYQFFGFYAAEGDDYQNMAGIRGGDGAFQNFLSIDGSITADTDGVNSTPGFSADGTFWWRIEKVGTTYICYRSADGEEFTEMFRYEDTGIAANKLVIDAYTGMTEGYEFLVKAIDFETAGPENVDFTDPAEATKFEIINPVSSEIREGEGLYMITTTSAFEDCNGQVTAGEPVDAVKVPVEGDWTATLKFNFSQASAANGYYQFFGFYAAQGDDYQNLAGIRGGDGAMQNFLRVAGSITADTDGINSTPGLSTDGTYWYRIAKEGTTYTCYRSADGEEFTEMFAYADTGIEADSIIIDAYTGMTEGYEFLLDSLTFDGASTPKPECEHAYEAVVTEPTCTEAGYTTYTCSKCGDSYVADETEATGHVWDGGEVTKEATEEEEGIRTFTCTVCEETKEEVIPKLEEGHVHDYEEVVTAPTCTAKGYTTYTCSCGDSYTGNEVAATGHKWDEGKVTTEPTEDKEGVKTYTCSVCGETKTEAIAKLPHTHDYKAVVTAPTCTEAGYTTYTCSKCGDEYVDDEVAALGHDWDDGVVTKEPTVDEEGVKTYTCSVCGETKTEAIEKLPPVPECPSKDFTDVPAVGHWAHEGIDYAVANGLMKGVAEGKFNPGGTLTRAELVTILYREAGSPEVEYKGIFEDVADDQWYTDAVEWAATNKIVNGVGDGTNFAPSATITREQIATILYRYSGEPEVEGDLKAFPDANKVSSFATVAMAWAVENKIITGASVDGVTYLKPLDSATREQIASIIMRYLEGE